MLESDVRKLSVDPLFVVAEPHVIDNAGPQSENPESENRLGPRAGDCDLRQNQLDRGLRKRSRFERRAILSRRSSTTIRDGANFTVRRAAW
jgi:hypothetical protein